MAHENAINIVVKKNIIWYVYGWRDVVFLWSLYSVGKRPDNGV